MISLNDYTGDRLHTSLAKAKTYNMTSHRFMTISELQAAVVSKNIKGVVWYDPDDIDVTTAFALYDADDKWQKVHTLFTFAKESFFPTRMSTGLNDLQGCERTQSICGTGEPYPPRVCLACKQRLVDGRDHYCTKCGSCPVCNMFNNSPEICCTRKWFD